MADAYPTCPRCNSLDLESALSLRTDSGPQSDTHTRWVRCRGCDARYIVEIEEDVNIGHDTDGHVTNSARSCDPTEWDRTVALARRCPHPSDPECRCTAHAVAPTTLSAAWYRSW